MQPAGDAQARPQSACVSCLAPGAPRWPRASLPSNAQQPLLSTAQDLAAKSNESSTLAAPETGDAIGAGPQAAVLAMPACQQVDTRPTNPPAHRTTTERPRAPGMRDRRSRALGAGLRGWTGLRLHWGLPSCSRESQSRRPPEQPSLAPRQAAMQTWAAPLLPRLPNQHQPPPLAPCARSSAKWGQRSRSNGSHARSGSPPTASQQG